MIRTILRRATLATSVAACFATACSGRGLTATNTTGFDDAGALLDGGALVDASVAPPIADVPCNDDGPCNDGFSCTDDRCDLEAGRCVHVAHDERCDDRVFCNGFEVCNVRRGCITGGDVCGVGNGCNIARCDEAARQCTTTPRDADSDGDPDNHCGGADCDDTDPRRSSRMSEICGNGLDDNCNAQVDESGCIAPQGDQCAQPVVMPAEGERTVSTAGATAPIPSGCSFPLSTTSKTIFVAVPRSSGHDTVLEVSDASMPVTLALLASCGAPATTCEQGAVAPFPRMLVTAAPTGSAIVAVTSPVESTLRLRTVALPATQTPATSDCTTPAPLVPGVPMRIDFTSQRATLPSDCASAGLRTFALEVPATSTLTLTARSLTGSGNAAIGLRQGTCSDLASEIVCRNSETGPLVHPYLAAGSYVVTVATATATAVELTATLTAPGTLASGSGCLDAIPVSPGQKVATSFDDRPDFVRSGCQSGGAASVFRLDIPSPSDLLIVGRVPVAANGSMALLDDRCTPRTAQRCSVGGTPFHVTRQAVRAGIFFVGLGTDGGGSGTLAAYTRTSVPETLVSGGGDCATAVPIGANGGRFSGDSTGLPSTVGTTCDTALANPRAPTQLFRLTLASRRRVLLDTSGSAFPTIASIRSGPTCPGSELPDGCHTGFGVDRSFLDRVLDPGTYWLVLTGFSSAQGRWTLDVFTADP